MSRRTDIERAAQRHRDFGASSFASTPAAEDELDPMSGIANLVDAMLVFACGLILALVVHYHVNISPDLTQVAQTGDMERIDSAEELTQSTDEGGKGYEDLGRAYRDPETGQMYVVVEE